MLSLSVNKLKHIIMKTKLISLFTLSLLFSVFCYDLTGQKTTSIFESCSHLERKDDIESCEKIVLINFIYKEFLPYAKTVKKSGPEYELWFLFNIEATGEVNEFEIQERITSDPGSYLKEIPIGRSYKSVILWDFIGSKKYVVYYKLPSDLIPDFDYEQLNFHAEGEEIYKVVEKMPRYPGCEDEKTEKQKEDCAKSKMLEYIYSQLKYPEEARINKIEGQVVVQFVVETDGSITDIRVVREIGYGCGMAVADIVDSMNHMAEKWIPGFQRGEPVRVIYTLPARFKL